MMMMNQFMTHPKTMLKVKVNLITYICKKRFSNNVRKYDIAENYNIFTIINSVQLVIG